MKGSMTDQPEQARGVLEMHDRRSGYLRSARRNYRAGPGDALVPGPLIDGLGLRGGLLLEGPASRGNAPRLLAVERVEGGPAADYRPRAFEELTATDPHDRLR